MWGNVEELVAKYLPCGRKISVRKDIQKNYPVIKDIFQKNATSWGGGGGEGCNELREGFPTSCVPILPVPTIYSHHIVVLPFQE